MRPRCPCMPLDRSPVSCRDGAATNAPRLHAWEFLHTMHSRRRTHAHDRVAACCVPASYRALRCPPPRRPCTPATASPCCSRERRRQQRGATPRRRPVAGALVVEDGGGGLQVPRERRERGILRAGANRARRKCQHEAARQGRGDSGSSSWSAVLWSGRPAAAMHRGRARRLRESDGRCACALERAPPACAPACPLRVPRARAGCDRARAQVSARAATEPRPRWPRSAEAAASEPADVAATVTRW